jgi:nicotinamidase-related amidase
MTTPIRCPELLDRRFSRLLIVDVQEKLVPTIEPQTIQRVIESCRILAEGANLFGVPLTITEQYPNGLGPTVETLSGYLETRPSKKTFSALECTGWPTAAESTDDRVQAVVAGLETHVCVLQTVLNLLAAGYQTFVVCDAVASRHEIDYRTALERMANSGAILTTAESVLFEWCESSNAPEFKQLSALVKNRRVFR